MKKTKKRAVLASIAIFAMVAMTTPAVLAEDRGEMPAENDIFWTLFAQMNHPTDSENCTAAVTAYVNSQSFDSEDRRQGELEGMLGFCTGVALMPADMQTSMTAEGVETTLFDNSNWHHVNGLYFKKSENGVPMGKISFSHEIDFMTYDFFTFMSNFGNMVQFNDGYISLNAAMVPQMINYGTTFTMYGLDFSTQPDIYVSNGANMRKAIDGTDVSGIVYDATAGTLSFTPGHFSSFKAVERGSTLKPMKISSVKKKSINYKANKNSFKITVKGKNLRQGDGGADCTLGFKQAQKIYVSKNGRHINCTFQMSDFSVRGYYPLTVSSNGNGEVTKTNAVRIK